MKPGDTDLADDIRDLRRRLDRLERSPRLGTASIGKGGLVVTDGGSLTVVDSVDGHVIALFGALPDGYNRADGTPQQGVMFNREDGSTALVLADATPASPPFKQSMILADRSKNTIFADDPVGGVGIGVPLLQVGALANTNVSTWPATSASSWTQIGITYSYRQNPGVFFAFYVGADSGTTGKVRLVVDGTPVATSPTVTSTYSVWSGSYLWPSGWSFLSQAAISLEAEVLTGSGSVHAVQLALLGTRSP